MTNTAQSEAMQAVRLLRGHALSGELTQAQIEALYQACKLLEGFIENDLRAKIDTALSDDEPLHLIRRFSGVRFKIGEWVCLTSEGLIGQVWFLNPDSITVRAKNGVRYVGKYWDLIKLNPLGSFTDNGEE
jgi:hypothetical protein